MSHVEYQQVDQGAQQLFKLWTLSICDLRPVNYDSARYIYEPADSSFGRASGLTKGYLSPTGRSVSSYCRFTSDHC